MSESESLEFTQSDPKPDMKPDTKPNEVTDVEGGEEYTEEYKEPEEFEGGEEEEKATVPVAAIKDERAKRQVAEQQVKDLTERFDRVVQAIIAKGGKLGPDQDEEPKAPEFPDFEKDPLGHLKTSLEFLRGKLEELTSDQAESKKQSRVKDQDQQLTTRWISDIQRYANNKPEVHQAFQFLANERAAELADMGYDSNETVQIISAETRDIVQRAYKTGQDPVEKFYKLAQKRGFNVNGKTKVEGERQEVQNLARGVPIGGKRGASAIDGQAISKMSEDQFEKFMKNKEWKSLR